MKRATIRFYAELNDFLPEPGRARTQEVRFHVEPSVKDVIESFGVPHTEVDLVLINGRSVDFSERVHDGDRIAVYPMFESIDIRPVLKVRPEPLRDPRFVLDVHLGRLTAYLRMLGFDAVRPPGAHDEELARISSCERRILLTRDRGLLKRSEVTHGYWVRETRPRRQLAEVVQRFDLAALIRPFTRCLRCNVELEPASREAVAQRVPEGVWERHNEFRTCPACGSVYWKGSHYQRMKRLIEEACEGS